MFDKPFDFGALSSAVDVTIQLFHGAP